MTDLQKLSQLIENAFEKRETITPASVPTEIKDAVLSALDALNNGSARVAELRNGQWHVNQWLKKAVLLSFRIWDNHVLDGAESTFFR
jgi:2,3,4,5-tetrahydropyridine-2-carboxylate N-succinyltransferase